jgi:hypothetical protein
MASRSSSSINNFISPNNDGLEQYATCTDDSVLYQLPVIDGSSMTRYGRRIDVTNIDKFHIFIIFTVVTWLLSHVSNIFTTTFAIFIGRC